MCCDRYELLQITSFTNDMIKNPLLIYVIEISSSSRAVQGEVLLRKDSTVSHKQSTLEPSEDRVLKTRFFQRCFLDLSTMTFRQEVRDISVMQFWSTQEHRLYFYISQTAKRIVYLHITSSLWQFWEHTLFPNGRWCHSCVKVGRTSTATS